MKLTPEKLTAFCAALAETGVVAKACKAVDISRVTAYEWRDGIPEFAAAWDKALRIGITALEDEAHRRAFEGLDEPLTEKGHFTYLRDFSAIDPETNKPYAPHLAPVLRDADGNPRMATMKKYSDTLAIFLLKAHAPEKYRENSRMELTGANGGPVRFTDTERAARIAAILESARRRAEQPDEPQEPEHYDFV